MCFRLFTTLLFFACIFPFGLKATPPECDNDLSRLCPQVETPRVLCLYKELSGTSESCQKAFTFFKKKLLDKNPCYFELADHCSEHTESSFHRMLCLMKHESFLGNQCLKDFKLKKTAFEKKEVCAQDLVKRCYSTLNQMEGLSLRCLIKNQKSLAPLCQTTIQQKITNLKKSMPCFEDTEKYCPNMVIRGEIDNCLTKKKVFVQPLCQKYLDQEEKIATKIPCYLDVKQFCKPGLSEGQVDQCLTVNEKNLSIRCQNDRTQRLKKIQTRADVCESDRKKFCAQVPFKGNDILKCLRKNQTQISARCKSLL